MPKVSICIPTYQNLAEVKRLLDSILQQTFQDMEILISDDSQDQAIADFVKKLKKEGKVGENQLCYTHNQRRLGHIYNWNAALEKASGEYIKIMFSDDWFTYPDSLEKLVRLLEEEPKAGLAFCASMQVSQKEAYARVPEEGYAEQLRRNHHYVFMSNQIGAPSDTLYRKAEGIRFDERSNWASDVFLYLEILNRNPVFVYTEEPLISIGIHEQQYTQSFGEKDERIYQDYRYLFQKYGLGQDHACRAYFLSRYLIPFSKGPKEAKENGYTLAEYGKAYLRYTLEEQLPCYLEAIKGRVLRKKEHQ